MLTSPWLPLFFFAILMVIFWYTPPPPLHRCVCVCNTVMSGLHSAFVKPVSIHLVTRASKSPNGKWWKRENKIKDAFRQGAAAATTSTSCILNQREEPVCAPHAAALTTQPGIKAENVRKWILQHFLNGRIRHKLEVPTNLRDLPNPFKTCLIQKSFGTLNLCKITSIRISSVWMIWTWANLTLIVL